LAMIFLMIAVVGMVWMIGSQQKTARTGQTAISETQTTGRPETTLPKVKLGAYVLRTVIVTGAILGIIWFGVRLYKKRLHSDLSPHSNIRIIGRQYLSARQYLVLVQAESKRLLLGVTDQSIRCLTEWADECSDEPQPSQETPQFGDSFRRITEQDAFSKPEYRTEP